MQAAVRVVKRLAKPRARGIVLAAAAGPPGSEHTATAPAGAGTMHERK